MVFTVNVYDLVTTIISFILLVVFLIFLFIDFKF